MSELDWSALQREAATAGVVPDGDYSTICVQASAVQSSNGKPMLKTKWRITEGPHKDKPVWTQFVISAENAVALRIFFQHMTALGLTQDYFATNPAMADVAKALENRVCVMTIGTRTWQGSDRNEVNSVRPVDPSTPLPPGAVTGAPVNGLSGMNSPSPLTTPVATTPATPASPVPTDAPAVSAASAPAGASQPPKTPF